MTEKWPTIWEDEDFVYIPEEFFRHLPPEYQRAAEARKQQGADVLAIADDDLKHLIRLTNTLPTTASLGYIFHRLRTAGFEPTAESLFEQEMLTTAFVVTYARLFVSGNGGAGVSRDRIPIHLRQVHDDLLESRQKRYAHNGAHSSVGSGLQIDFDDDGFKLSLQMNMGLYIGGRNEWADLVRFLDAHMHDRLYKILARLKQKTGYEWTIPTGPAPTWMDDLGSE